MAVKRFNVSLQLSVLQYGVMKPSVTEESLATKLCNVFGLPRGYSVWPGIYISGARRDPNLSDLDACALLETLRPSSRLWERASDEEPNSKFDWRRALAGRYLGPEHCRSGLFVSDSYRTSIYVGIE